MSDSLKPVWGVYGPYIDLRRHYLVIDESTMERVADCWRVTVETEEERNARIWNELVRSATS